MAVTFSTRSTEIKQAWKKYNFLWKEKRCGSKHLLLQEGKISRKIFLIDKGAIRTWFYNDGREISFQFFFEGDIVSSPWSFRNNTASPFSIETIEPASLRWIDRQDMSIIKKDPVLSDYITDRAARKQDEFMRHFFSYLTHTPRQRYLRLVSENTEILKRVPLQYVASYLGITPVSLSRIRNKII